MQPVSNEKRKVEGELDQLMELYQQSDKTATIALIEAVNSLLFHFFLDYPSNQDNAADLLQDTWLRVHRVRHTYRPGEPVLPWLYAIARHVRADRYRRQRRISCSEQAMGTVPEPRIRKKSSPSTLLSCDFLMGALPPSQREFVTMLKRMSSQDIARATASDAGALKLRAYRAYQKLRQVLEQRRSNGFLAR